MANTRNGTKKKSTKNTKPPPNYQETHPLHYAASENLHALLLQHLPITPINSLDTKGRTPLHWAARNGHTSLCALLLRHGADVHTVSRPPHQKNKQSNNEGGSGDNGVTCLELAVWKCHYATASLLSQHGGPTLISRINGYGCGLAHWCALSSRYADSSSSSSSLAVESDVHDIIELLTSHGIDFKKTNGHGQTPFHKAAYSGNIPVLRYLLSLGDGEGTVDNVVDEDGNTAADCAERAGRMDVARFVRRYGSVLWREACRTLNLGVEWDDEDGEEGYVRRRLRLPRPPRLDVVRRGYLEAVRRVHPDGAGGGGGVEEWFRIHAAYCLLKDWWGDDVGKYDEFVRRMTRNGNLVDAPPLLLTDGVTDAAFCREDGVCSSVKEGKTYDDALLLFEMRLRHLLLIPNYREGGLRMDHLPRLYSKSYPGEKVPNPKEFQCRKLVHLIQRRCSAVCRVEYSDVGVVLWPEG